MDDHKLSIIVVLATAAIAGAAWTLASNLWHPVGFLAAMIKVQRNRWNQLNNVSYSIQYIPNSTIRTCNQDKINELLYICFLCFNSGVHFISWPLLQCVWCVATRQEAQVWAGKSGSQLLALSIQSGNSPLSVLNHRLVWMSSLPRNVKQQQIQGCKLQKVHLRCTQSRAGGCVTMGEGRPPVAPDGLIQSHTSCLPSVAQLPCWSP